MSKDKNYKKSEVSELKNTIRNLKAKVSSRDKRLRILQSEMRTLKRGFGDSVSYIDERLEQVPVEEIVKYFKDKKKGSLDDVEKSYSDTKDKLIIKWSCRKCYDGHLRLIVIDRHDGEYYIRACVNPKCSNRTKMQKYNDSIEGVTND